MTVGPVVYIWGDESFLVDRALRNIETEALGESGADFNREIFEAPDAKPGAVATAAKTLPFLGGRRLVIVKGAHQWAADDWQPLIRYIEAPNPTTCLVFLAASLDRRTKAGKLLEKKASLIECKKPADREIAGWAQRLSEEAGLRARPGALEVLAYRVGADLQLLSREIEKLRVFVGEGGTVTAEAVETLVGQSRAASIFTLCDALGERNLAVALKTLRRLLELGEPSVKIVYMIHRHFRNLWLGRELAEGSGRSDRQAAARILGVPPFVAENLLRQARNWSADALRGAFRRLLASDLALKSGGSTEVLEGLVFHLTAGGGVGRKGAPPPRAQKSPGRGRGF